MHIGNRIKTSGWNTLIFRPWSTNLLVSVGQTTRQRMNYFYVNKAISMSGQRAPLISCNWRWYILKRNVYGSHITLFYQFRDWEPPKRLGPWLQPSQYPP